MKKKTTRQTRLLLLELVRSALDDAPFFGITGPPLIGFLIVVVVLIDFVMYRFGDVGEDRLFGKRKFCLI